MKFNFKFNSKNVYYVQIIIKGVNHNKIYEIGLCMYLYFEQFRTEYYYQKIINQYYVIIIIIIVYYIYEFNETMFMNIY